MEWQKTQLTSTLSEHSGPIADLTFSPDGRLLACGSCDSSVKIWDVETGQRLRSVFGYPLGVNAVAISPEGKILAVGVPDGNVDLWEIQTGQHLLTLKGKGRITSLAFTPKGKTLICGSDPTFCDTIFASPAGQSSNSINQKNGTINIWHISTAKLLQSFGESDDTVNALSLSFGGKNLVTGHRDNTVKLWDIKYPEKPLYIFNDHTDAVYAVAISPDSEIVASGSGDKTIKISHIKTGNSYSLIGHTEAIYDIIFSPDGNFLASSSGDGTIVIWQLKTAQKIFSLQGYSHHLNSVNTITFSPDGKKLASGCGDGTIKIWNIP